MIDRELLEYAAKAAGMWETDFCLDDDCLPCFDDEKGFYLAWGKGWWNPKKDDGDALRLAVKLRLDVAICNGTSYADGTESVFPNVGESQGEDPYAATRRAIVRAAAEIGKAMQ